MIKKSIYALHPAYAYQNAIVDNLKAKTGKNINEWKKLLKTSGIKIEADQKEWLKKKHSLGGTTVNVILDSFYRRGGSENYNPEKLVDNMYSGKKENLRPLFEKLLTLCFSVGKDVKASPTKTMVPIYRNHVIANIKPATNSRIDLGLALQNTKISDRLKSSGGLEKGDRISHYISITKSEDIDGRLKEWLLKAYKLDEK